MNSKLHAKIVTMAAATLGLGLMAGCAKKSEAEPAAAEGGATAAGAETSCGGANGCGSHHSQEAQPQPEGEEGVNSHAADAPAAAPQ
jgi:hypothetical protein